ncbi:hypothetical protein TcCL_NonESM03167 [Trypanosoma cruzi]|nr:hypothetical protein TcCL_NonESM03167 [Trypanosoma cruzi]
MARVDLDTMLNELRHYHFRLGVLFQTFFFIFCAVHTFTLSFFLSTCFWCAVADVFKGKRGGKAEEGMTRVLTMYTVALGLFELLTIILIFCGGTLDEVTPWFDSVTPFKRRSYACMYMGVLVLLVTSRFLLAYLPRHRLIRIHNALVHVLELCLFMLLWWVKQGPASVVCYVLLAVMTANCVVFGLQAFRTPTRRGEITLHEKKNR